MCLWSGMTKDSHEHVGQIPAPEKGVETNFPAGLRVLAVDDNVVCLKLLARLLQECRYNVTVSANATQALEMLRKNKDNYDIVITDVKMPDMDGYELLEIIGLEMDLPVIMMSASDDTESVMKGIEHGARDYLLKPVRLEELRNIWQHVIRKNGFDTNKVRVVKTEMDENPIPSKRQREKGKGKENDTNNQFEGEFCAQKKLRVTWTPELHRKFVAAVQQLGTEAVPKKILEVMNVPRLSRENVASHLQKYRNLLKKDKAKASKIQESNSNVDPNRTNGHIPTSAITLSYDKQTQNAINFHNMRQISAPSMNMRPPFLPMNSQENRINPPAPIFVANTYTQPLSNNFHAISGRQQRFDDYMEGFQSSLAGKNVQQNNMFMFNESGGLDFGGQTVEFQFDRNVHIEGSSTAANGQTMLLHPPPESLERESSGQYYSWSSPDDDDLGVMVKQFGNNSTPKI